MDCTTFVDLPCHDIYQTSPLVEFLNYRTLSVIERADLWALISFFFKIKPCCLIVSIQNLNVV